MEAMIIKSKPIQGRIYGKIFNTNEKEKFFSVVEQIRKSNCRNYEIRFHLGKAGKFERGIITVEV